jgi:hypothetical protein
MRSATRVFNTSAFVVGIAALWTAEAHGLVIECGAGTIPCNVCAPQVCVYTPAVYTSGAAGDVAVNTASTNSVAQSLVEDVVGPLTPTGGSVYVHTKLLVSPPAGIPVGSYFAETFPSLLPPTTHKTGEENECSKVFSPFFIQRMYPGAGKYYEDAQPGVLVKAFGNPNCNPPADGYHIASLLQDTVPGGSCEKELVDYCGVPVAYNIDRRVYTATEGFDALSAGFNGLYNTCMTEIGQWYGFWQQAGCDDVSNSIMCQRAAWQVTNEVRWPAYPQEYWGLGGCNSYGCGYMTGWSDFNVAGPPPNPAGPFPPANYNVWTGTMLGAAKTNGQLIAYAPPSPSQLAAGACDTGSCNNAPINAPGWAPSNFTANIPQNIINAASRLGKTIVTVEPNSGIQNGYNTCQPPVCHASCCSD